MNLFVTDKKEDLQGDIFGNWKPIKIVNRERKIDKFFSKLRKEQIKKNEKK